MESQRGTCVLKLMAICATLTFVIYYMLSNMPHFRSHGRDRPNHPLDIIPHNYTGYCEDLFAFGSAAEKFVMSPAYMRSKGEFLAEASKHRVNDGHTHQFELQYRALHYLASSPNVRTVCETGFNAGHSSFNWLTANDNIIVYSFDLGNHTYALKMAKYLASKFKNRITVTFGDSLETLPKFSAANPDVRCDVMFVDGRHSYEMVMSDLRHFIPMARNLKNVIIIDDYPSKRGLEVGRAWNETIKSGNIKKLMSCSTKNRKRGFSVGTVVH